MTILPQQFRRLASFSRQVGCALGVSQDGSVLRIQTSARVFYIDADGNDCEPQPKETE